MSEEQLVKLNGRTYDQFRTGECYDLDSFDYEFDYSNVRITNFKFDDGVIYDFKLSGVEIEDQFQYVIVNTHELKKLFISKPEPTVKFDVLRKAIYTALERTLCLRSHSLGDEPVTVSASDIATWVEGIYIETVDK